GLPQKPAVNATSRSEPRAANTSRNSDGDEVQLVSQNITSTANSNEGLDGEMDEMLGMGENPAFVSTADTPFSGTAIDRRCLPPSLMHGKPIPGSSGLENDPRKSQKKGPHLQYQNGFMDTPHPSNGSEGQLGLYFKPDAGSKGNVQNVLSGLHSHRNNVHEVADTQASKPSSDGHNYSYRGDYGRPFNDKSFRPEGGKVVQKAPPADSVQGNNDEMLIYENVSSRRQLPVTLLNEKHSGSSLPAGYGAHYHGTVEDKPKETDERLIFRAALEGLAQPRVEASLPDGLLSVPLLRHQKIALAWMVHQETHSFHCAGGILADDQGLGKTVSTIALILMQRDQHSKFISDSTEQVKRETLNLDEDGDGPAEISSNEQHKHSDCQSKAVTSYRMASVQKGRPVAGTLIVCPASVLRQWAQELSDKVADDAKLLFLVYYGTNRTKDPFELAKYDVVLTTYSIAYADEGTVNQNYANILLLLLRLRQACDHPLLVKGYRSASSKKSSAEAAQKPNDMLMNLLKHLETSSAICAICSDPPEDAVITICGHIFCNQCISERLTGDDNFCPSPDCRSQISTDFIFSRSILQGGAGHSNTDSDSTASSRKLKEFGVEPSACSSSKIRAVLDILQSLNMRQADCNTSSAGCGEVHVFTSKPDMSCSADSNKHALAGIKLSTPVALPEKAIVFSQWTSMLDLLEISLKNSFINYRRLDGTMTLSARDKAVKDFNTLPEVTVMIMSLKAGNLGLNMVAANHVVLLDLWWNPTTEDQAIDRAHRIGQTRPVTVFRLTIENTIEDRILALQEEKRKMVASAFAEDQTGSFATRLTVEDLRYLFMV
ncbi:Helicase-like transcription factor, partial [Nymphaea thermarum]